MDLDFYRRQGMTLPAPETDYSSITTQQIMDKIKAFYERLRTKPTDIEDFAESYFLMLLRDYPVSMCSYNMTDTLKFLIALFYFDSKPEFARFKINDGWQGYSFDDLALIFDRSKATLHGAIRQKETEVKELLSSAKLRQQAKNIALEELVREEKEKLLSEKQRNNQTCEQTAI